MGNKIKEFFKNYIKGHLYFESKEEFKIFIKKDFTGLYSKVCAWFTKKFNY